MGYVLCWGLIAGWLGGQENVDHPSVTHILLVPGMDGQCVIAA
jgi:hypothetical protein